ncbi:hypothetical protein [Klebsiella sp. WP4-W18-ESBL-05]|uniref:hypothetical protein n=1 Tax=Klebsiella sp. WP4-W18-ESBL-05 TaxID=2675713 RepID=UPI0015FEE319|nr:hypothetical protein [Klebsiella sp. WP4-W18-ESBL-05]
MKMTTRKKPQWKDLYHNGVFTRVVAVKNDRGRWSLFGVHRSVGAAMFVEAARGGIREWSGLSYLGDFCDSMGVSLWEVHHKSAQKEQAA